MTVPPLTLLQSADLLGRYRYVELAAFAAIGGRAISATSPATARFLAAASVAHGWRARLVEERLPVSLGLPGTDACTRTPSVIVDQAIALAVEPGDDDEVLTALIGGLYPAMEAAYRERIDVAAPAPDGPVVRALGRILGDLEAVSAEGVALLAGRTGSARADRVVRLLADVGGPFGPLIDRQLFTTRS